MKTNKSFTKRIKITKNGKLKVRKAGQNHFNAKASRNKQLDKKRSADFVLTTRDVRRYITTG